MSLKFFLRKDYVREDDVREDDVREDYFGGGELFYRIKLMLFLLWICGLRLSRLLFGFVLTFVLVLSPISPAKALTSEFRSHDLLGLLGMPIQISQGFEYLMPKTTPEIKQGIKIVEVSRLPNQGRNKITVNAEQTYQAFTICRPLSDGQGCQEQIFIEDLITGKFYQIQGIPLSWRPFTNLTWTRETYLEFDRWSNPHYGFHYVVDMSQKKLVNISALEK